MSQRRTTVPPTRVSSRSPRSGRSGLIAREKTKKQPAKGRTALDNRFHRTPVAELRAGPRGPRAAQRRAFYESDCQGQFSPLLVAFSSFLLQSAPTDRNAAIVRTHG